MSRSPPPDQEITHAHSEQIKITTPTKLAANIEAALPMPYHATLPKKTRITVTDTIRES